MRRVVGIIVQKWSRVVKETIKQAPPAKENARPVVVLGAESMLCPALRAAKPARFVLFARVRVWIMLVGEAQAEVDLAL